MGILTDEISKILGEKKEIKYQNMGSVGPGTTVMIPENAVKSDGSVDIIIQIRGIAGGDLKTAGKLGLNAVVITAEAGGIGSKENQEMFGNASFVNSAVSKVLGFLQKKFPDKKIHRGKLALSWFSGGYAAGRNILMQRKAIPGGIDAAISIDGMHDAPGTPGMQAYIDFAKEVAKDPNKKFVVIHSAVNPGKYTSTTQAADQIVNNLGIQRAPVEQWNGQGTKPKTKAQLGGVEVTQLYDKEQPYMAKDEHGVTRPNVRGQTSGGQHIDALDWGVNNAFKELGWN
jgi:hypothetical protein